MNKRDRIAIIDLDGTLANVGHRLHLIEKDKPEWDKFYKECINDTVNPTVKTIFDEYKKIYGDVRIWTGRSDIVKDETVKWLRDNVIINYSELRMRKNGDYRSDLDIKKEWIMEVGHDNISVAVDDAPYMIYLYKLLKIPCIKVNDSV